MRRQLLGAFARCRPALLPRCPRYVATDPLPLPPASDCEPVVVIRSKPRRRWMSVTDLVAEVEQSLVVGVRLVKDDRTYEHLKEETIRLRKDNDAITESVAELQTQRAAYVAKEVQMVGKDLTISVHADEMVDILDSIKEVDAQIAALRNQHHRNVKDVGYLKRTMHLIDRKGRLMALIDRVDDLLASDDPVSLAEVDSALQELVGRLREEYDNATRKLLSYEVREKDLVSKLKATDDAVRAFRDYPGQPADSIRTDLIAHLLQAKRMAYQANRIRDIQLNNAREIGRLDRARAKLGRHAEILSLRAAGDKEKIVAKLELLHEDRAGSQRVIEEMEGGLAEHTQQIDTAIATLRTLKEMLTPQTGEIREKLVANIHGEEERMRRLAVLRGEQALNIRALVTLKAALAE